MKVATSRCRQVIESMNVCYLLWSRSFLDLDSRSFKIKIKIMVLSEITLPVKVKFYVEPPCEGGGQILCAKSRSNAHKILTISNLSSHRKETLNKNWFWSIKNSWRGAQ